jgi:hypothetical protein
VKLIVLEHFCFLNSDDALVKYQADDGHVIATKQEIKVTGVSHIYQKLTKVRCTLLLHPYFSLIPISSKVISDNIIYRYNTLLLVKVSYETLVTSQHIKPSLHALEFIHNSVLCINSSAC